MPPKIPDEKLLKAISALADDLGRSPTMAEMEEQGEYGKNTYNNHFGTWTKAIRESGLAPKRERNIGRQALLSELRELNEKTDTPPRQEDMDEYGSYSAYTYVRRFGSWNEALAELGISHNRRTDITSEELVSHLEDFSAELNQTPRIDDMAENGRFAVNTYIRRFGSWNAALEEAGLDKNVIFHGKSEDSLYGKYWKTRREKALERDSWRCQSCGKHNSQHIQKCGRSLEVHHITPAWKFEDPSERHDLDNLVTLCRDCHLDWEGIELKPELVTGGA